MEDVRTKDEELMRSNGSSINKRHHHEEETVASVLLALDGGSSKRRRPSTPKFESRDSPHVVLTPSAADQRESLDNDREQASPVSTTKLSHRFMSRFEVTSSPTEGQQATPSKIGKKAGSNELDSAMALASLANQGQRHLNPPRSPTHHGKAPAYSQYSPMYQSSMHPQQMHPQQMHPPPMHPHQTHPPPMHPQQMHAPQTYPQQMHPPQMHQYSPYAHPDQAMYMQGRAPGPSPQYTPSAYGFHPGPPRQPPAPSKNGGRQWACDFCDQVSFNTYEEACNHEKVCSYNPRAIKNDTSLFRPRLKSRAVSIASSNSHGSSRSLLNSGSSRSLLNSDSISSPADEDESKFFCGAIKLEVPIADPEWLSEMNCYIRKNCIEAFSANRDDVFKSSKRGRIAMKQVGIRCVFCVKEDVDKRAMSAISYPVSSSGIYESVRRWSKIHLPLCKCIPKEIKGRIDALEKASNVPTTRQYWIDSAKALGIQDTPGGLRFTHDVNDSSNAERASKQLLSVRSIAQANSAGKDENPGTQIKDNYIVHPADESVITPFLYALLRQLEPCQFTDADRYIARSRCPQGFHGFQCRHCSGHAGLGKYFPTSPKALSTNSTSQNIFSHVLKCRKCPEDVKEKLKTLKYDKGHWTRRTTGWRQKFFEDVWKRLHGEQR